MMRRKKRYMTLNFCFALVAFLNTTMKEKRYDVRKVSVGCTQFVLVWREILFVSLVRDK
jgi:hypothetical protein